MKYSDDCKVYRIRYYNVWFYLFAKTEMDEYKINILGERIGMGDSMMMKDIHCWCTRQNIRYEEVQSLAETWGMIAAGGFIREMQETRILVPDGELMVFLGNEGLDYFVCPEEVLKGTAHTLKPALDVAIYSEAYFPERSYQGAKLRLPAEPAFLKDAKMRAFIHENEPWN